jgi:hypothetical protein
MCLASLALAVLCFASSLAVLVPSARARLLDPAVRVVQGGAAPAQEIAEGAVVVERTGLAPAAPGGLEGESP